MKNFFQWAEEVKFDLNSLVSAENPAPTTENTKRAGVKAIYPDAYVRAQYPGVYFTPISATAALDLQNAKKK